jgi:glycosyltransferase involved in cell wall biosynthesis
MVLHTTPVDGNGTDLPKLIKHLLPEYQDNIVFSANKITQKQLNCLYNIADSTILISSNEGFGLGTAESIAAGTPIIVNVTGGLQDQCGFKKDGKYLTADDYVEIGSLHDWRKWEGNIEHGEWVTPVWSRTTSLVGSPPTPYIYDDRVDVVDVTNAIEQQYQWGREERKRRGNIGREWLMNEGGLNVQNMCNIFTESMTREIENYKTRKRFEVYSL